MSDCTFDHVHIFSDNVEQTVEYYKTIFQAIELRRFSDNQAVMVHLSLNNSRIVVSTATADKRPGIHHYAIATDQFERAIERIKKTNCVFESEIIQNGLYRTIFFRDPNNVITELISPSTK